MTRFSPNPRTAQVANVVAIELDLPVARHVEPLQQLGQRMAGAVFAPGCGIERSRAALRECTQETARHQRLAPAISGAKGCAAGEWQVVEPAVCPGSAAG